MADHYPGFVRIVSLLPSTTEIVFQLGLAEQLFGVTFECNFPPEARKGRAIVVGGMDTAHLDPKEIDELVRARMAAGEDLYALDEEALSRCDPDLILSQDLCRVCAVSSGNVDEAVAKLGCRAQVLQIDPQTLDEVIDSVQTVADAAGVADRGRELVAQLRARLARLQDAVAATRRRTETPAPRVFVLEWTDPPFVGGHWVPDVVAAAGGLPVLSRPGEKSVSATWDEIRAVDPDIVVVSPCGYGLSGAEAQGRSVLGQLPERAQVFAIDADAVMVRPGPRLVDGAEALAAAFFGPDVLGMSALPRDLISRLR